MEISMLHCRALSISVAVAMLAGCGGSQPPIVAPGTMTEASTSSDYTTLYSFGKRSGDGQASKAGLIDFRGALYGTTYDGGLHGLGTVFKISTSGIEKVVHSFQGNGDGANPSASLVAEKGLLYGTTEYGGTSSCYPESSCGTAFSVTRSGREKVLHAFGGYGRGE